MLLIAITLFLPFNSLFIVFIANYAAWIFSVCFTVAATLNTWYLGAAAASILLLSERGVT